MDIVASGSKAAATKHYPMVRVMLHNHSMVWM